MRIPKTLEERLKKQVVIGTWAIILFTLTLIGAAIFIWHFLTNSLNTGNLITSIGWYGAFVFIMWIASFILWIVGIVNAIKINNMTNISTVSLIIFSIINLLGIATLISAIIIRKKINNNKPQKNENEI